MKSRRAHSRPNDHPASAAYQVALPSNPAGPETRPTPGPEDPYAE